MPEGQALAAFVGIAGVFLGAIGGIYLYHRQTQRRIAAAEHSAGRILSEADRRQKEKSLDRKIEGLEQRQRNLANKETELEEAKANLLALEDQRKQELERVSRLTVMEARGPLLAQVEREIRDE